MGNVKLIFCGTDVSDTTSHELKVYCNMRNEMFISIDMNMKHDFGVAFICLDKSTAIKLSKELRKQIALLEN